MLDIYGYGLSALHGQGYRFTDSIQDLTPIQAEVLTYLPIYVAEQMMQGKEDGDTGLPKTIDGRRVLPLTSLKHVLKKGKDTRPKRRNAKR